MSKASFDEDRKRMLASFDSAFGELGFKRKKVTYLRAHGKEIWVLDIDQHQGFRVYLGVFYPELYPLLPWVGDRPVRRDGPRALDCPLNKELTDLRPGGGSKFFQWDWPEGEQEVIDLVKTYAISWFEKYSDPLTCSQSEYADSGKLHKLFVSLAKSRAREIDGSQP
jgi:hypothetical protein